jgi:apolipoprotein D and lipocalin family protein
MKNNKIMLFAVMVGIGITACYTLNACKSVQVPPGLKVVTPFNIDKYIGTWYEIARFDFKHEKNLKNVTATYSKNDDGSVKVVNKGYDYIKQKEKVANGKAKFVGAANEGALKVSFFGPFYSGYNVVMMDPAYENVLIFGESTDYIWILSRHKTIPASTKEKMLAKAKEHGYDLNRLVWTAQE